MKLEERAEALAHACSEFDWLGIANTETLLSWVRLELGDALEKGLEVPGGGRSLAIPPAVTLHIVSGNTPHAALQSLVRGLLLGGQHWVKLPGNGLPEAEQFVQLLPQSMQSQIVMTTSLAKDWITHADLIVAFGSDATLAEIRAKLLPHQRWIGHGHKFGCGFVFESWEKQAVALAAEDVIAFDQMGCLSPIAFFVERNPSDFAEKLAEELANAEIVRPRRALHPTESAAIASARAEWVFRQNTENDCRIWASENSTAWTVVFDASHTFPSSPLHRFIFVKPMPQDLPTYFLTHRLHLSTAGISPANSALSPDLILTGFQRICPLGRMQKPSPFWHPDGFSPLAGRVRWIDIEIA